MITIERQVVTATPFDRVTAYLSDFTNTADWDPHTEKCERLDSGPLQAGARYRNVQKVAGKSSELSYELVDYRPAEQVAEKRPKGSEPWTVELVPTTDVARALGAARRDGQVLVAFGAESGEDGLARKRAMLADKNVDLVVYNDVGRADIGFETLDNEVTLVTSAGERTVPKASKPEIAAAILDEVESLIAETT